MITENEVMLLGAYCSELMKNEDFNRLTQLAELSAFQAFQSTAPSQVKEREQAYLELMGLRNFLAMMAEIVGRREDLLAEQQLEAPSDDGLEH
jgi:hypothetical protein